MREPSGEDRDLPIRRVGARSPCPSPSPSVTLTIDGLTPTHLGPTPGEQLIGGRRPTRLSILRQGRDAQRHARRNAPYAA
jgi:hypothetical protein